MKSLQLDRPHAIIVIGIQGSGKTFFAEKFAGTFNAPYIEQAMFEHAAASDVLAKELMNTVLAEMLKTSRSIIIELTLPTKTERAELSKVLKQAGYIPMYVWVQVDIETAMTRSHRASGINPEDYKDRIRRFTAPHQNEHVLVVSGKHTFATQAKVVLRKLSAPRPSQEPPRRTQPQRGQIIVR
jgi:adenylate kinase family enzyme